MRHSAGWRSSASACRPPLRSSPRFAPGQARAGGAPARSKGSTTKPAVADATTPITFRGPGGRRLMGAWATAPRARGGVLVVHENRGLTDHIRSVASRLAASGYSALAIDLLSEEGGTGLVPRRGGGDGGAVRRPHDAVRRRHEVAESPSSGGACPRKKIGATGFCFGGGMVWTLLAAKESRLAAAAPFYGPFPEGSSLKGSKAAVLGIYARARLAREREQAGRGRRATRGRGCRTSSSPSPAPTTPSSTTPARGTTALRPRPRTSACSPGSRGTSASPFARRPAGRARTRHPRPRPAGRGAGGRRRRRCEAGRRVKRSVRGSKRTSAFAPKSVSQTTSRLVDVDRVGLRRGARELPLAPAAARRVVAAEPGPAFHSLTQIRPRESDQTRRAPWSGVGGCDAASPCRCARRCARCGCRRARRSRRRREA